MNNYQLAKYQEILNHRAIERLSIKQSKLSKAEKQERFYEIDLKIKAQMESVLRPEQVDVWWRNLNKVR